MNPTADAVSPAPLEAATPNDDAPTSRVRLDIFRRDAFFLCVARSDPWGSIGVVHAGEIESPAPSGQQNVNDDDQRKLLGAKALEWLQQAEALDPPTQSLRFPDDLLPEGWHSGHWYELMSHADLCSVEALEFTAQDATALRLRPFKNLCAVGEEFSHEGGHALICSREPRAVGSGLRAALDISHDISRLRQSPAFAHGEQRLAPQILAELRRLGARLFDRKPQTEVVEITEGFFLLPAALRQALFDVVWRRGTTLRSVSQAQLWQVRWFPLSQQPRLRRWPLVELAETSGVTEDATAVAILRLDDPHPDDPRVYFLASTDDPEVVLGAHDAPSQSLREPRLSQWLADLSPVAQTPAELPAS